VYGGLVLVQLLVGRTTHVARRLGEEEAGTALLARQGTPQGTAVGGGVEHVVDEELFVACVAAVLGSFRKDAGAAVGVQEAIGRLEFGLGGIEAMLSRVAQGHLLCVRKGHTPSLHVIILEEILPPIYPPCHHDSD
jgi:hypothetical protein